MSRSDRGARLDGLRLIGAHTSDTWSAPMSDLPPGSVRAGAEWVRERLAALSERNGRSGKILDCLCLDVDGSVCSWVGAGQGERQVVRAMLETGIGDEPGAGPGAGPGAASRFPDLPGELDLEPLGEGGDGGGGGGRLGVMAIPDVPARLMMDQLDALGVRVGNVMTIWHAAALAWDASTGDPGGGLRSDRVVASDSPLTGVVLIDAAQGRCLWVWSDAGKPIAAGSMRVSVSRSDEPGATMTESDTARLGLEWLSWSAQLGRTPGRVSVVGACGQADELVEGALDGPELGAALSRACAGATIDLYDVEDPVGQTLTRLAERGEGSVRSGPGLKELATRPVRAHRAMYIWAGVAMALGAGGLATLANSFLDQKRELSKQIEQAKENRIAILRQTDLQPATEYKDAMLVLPGKIQALKAESAPAEPIMPVLEEFETLSFVLANPEWDLVSLSLTPAAVSVRVSVPDVVQAEAFEDAVLSITGSYLSWTPMNFRELGGRVDCNMTGQWTEAATSGRNGP